MRYRTVTVPIKEMGYLFVSVALGLINSLATTQDSYIVLITANIFIILLPILIDRGVSETAKKSQKDKKAVEEVPAPADIKPNVPVQDIIYERIDLIHPENRLAMIEDLRNRTGLPVNKVEIVNIDLMHDVAVIKAYYSEIPGELFSVSHLNGQDKKGLLA